MNKSNRSMLKAGLLAVLAVIPSCGPGEVAPECVAVDEQLGTPGERMWCEGEFTPSIPWEGELAVKTLPICFAPRADGECELCPSAKVIEDVETRLYPHLAETRPLCQLDHWEFGCMRTIENAVLIGREPDYCCFQVALWGEGCADQP